MSLFLRFLGLTVAVVAQIYVVSVFLFIVMKQRLPDANGVYVIDWARQLIAHILG